MAVKFKVVKRKVLNGAEKDSVKNYAIAKTSGTSDLNKLCKLICSRSTLSSADVKAVLDSLNWAMDLELSSGNVVQLGEFGNFRMSINSEGTNTPEDFDATKIKGVRIIFFPGSALRTTRNEVNFEAKLRFDFVRSKLINQTLYQEVLLLYPPQRLNL